MQKRKIPAKIKDTRKKLAEAARTAWSVGSIIGTVGEVCDEEGDGVNSVICEPVGLESKEPPLKECACRVTLWV